MSSTADLPMIRYLLSFVPGGSKRALASVLIVAGLLAAWLWLQSI